MRLEPAELDTREIRGRFDRVAETFDDGDYVHRATFEGLVERLQPVAIDARIIVDLGSATGTGSAALAKQFRKARIVGIDASRRMLQKSFERRSFLSKVREVQADARKLPLRDHSVDLVVANMLLPWIADPGQCFAEVNRVLRKDGVFAFASLGPDSMSEFRSLTGASAFPDMHDLGDGVIRAGLRDPVLDVDRLRITWGSMDELLADLLACGAIGGDAEAFRIPASEFPGRDDSGRLAMNLELVYGHAWGSGPLSGPGEYHVDPATIGRRGGP